MVELTKQFPEQRNINAAIDKLEESTEVASHLPTKADLRLMGRKSDRNRLYILAGVALISLAALLIAVTLIPRLSALENSTAINTGSIDTLAKARDDLRAAGVPEDQLPPVVAAPEPGAPVDVDALVNATAATILAKIRTDPVYRGAAGLQGDAGPMGPQGPPGSAPACLTTPTQCQGAEGAQGPKGDEGDRGPEGPAPPCLEEASQCRGQDGERGPEGPQGPPGEPCAPGYDPSVVNVLVPNPEPTPEEPFALQQIQTCTPSEGP